MPENLFPLCIGALATMTWDEAVTLGNKCVMAEDREVRSLPPRERQARRLWIHSSNFLHCAQIISDLGFLETPVEQWPTLEESTNEARKAMGLQPLPNDDPFFHTPAAAYARTREAKLKILKWGR